MKSVGFDRSETVVVNNEHTLSRFLSQVKPNSSYAEPYFFFSFFGTLIFSALFSGVIKTFYCYYYLGSW